MNARIESLIAKVINSSDTLPRADKDAVDAASFECSGQDIIDEGNGNDNED